MADWAPAPAPAAMQAVTLAAAMRSASVALRGEWGDLFARLRRDAAWGDSAVHTCHRWNSGHWSP
eukprot:5494192-Pyramimonas_sp.AAC.1